MLFFLDLMLLLQLFIFYFFVAAVGTFTWVSIKRIGLFDFSNSVNKEHWILPLVFVCGVWLWSWGVVFSFLLSPFSDLSVDDFRLCLWIEMLKCGLKSRMVPAHGCPPALPQSPHDPDVHLAYGLLSNCSAWICNTWRTNEIWLYACSSEQDYTNLIPWIFKLSPLPQGNQPGGQV